MLTETFELSQFLESRSGSPQRDQEEVGVKLPLWAKWIWWLGLVVITSAVLWKRLELTVSGGSTAFDCVVFVVWVALLLAPIFSEVKIWGVELTQEIEKTKKDLSQQIQSVRTEVRNSINLHATFSAVSAPPPDYLLPSIRDEIDHALNARMTGLNVAPQTVEPQVPPRIHYMFSVRYNIEREVRRITDALLDQRSRTQIRRQVEILADTDSIQPEMKNAILDVYRICSPAVHGDQVSKEQEDFVRDVAPRLLAALQDITALRPD